MSHALTSYIGYWLRWRQRWLSVGQYLHAIIRRNESNVNANRVATAAQSKAALIAGRLLRLGIRGHLVTGGSYAAFNLNQGK